MYIKIIYFHFLKSSETHFDQIAIKIGAELNNFVIYGDILVDFLRIFSTKSTISQKTKILEKKCHSIQNIAQFFERKPNLATFERGEEEGLSVVN